MGWHGKAWSLLPCTRKSSSGAVLTEDAGPLTMPDNIPRRQAAAPRAGHAGVGALFVRADCIASPGRAAPADTNSPAGLGSLRRPKLRQGFQEPLSVDRAHDPATAPVQQRPSAPPQDCSGSERAFSLRDPSQQWHGRPSVFRLVPDGSCSSRRRRSCAAATQPGCAADGPEPPAWLLAQVVPACS
jgi:hypothetical protein